MKVKYAGRKTFYDENGNPIEMEVIQKHYDTIDKRRWRRVVLTDFLEVLEQIGNKKIKVLEYLIDNMNSNNEIDLSQREIAEATKISIQTINTTMKALTEANVIKKIKRKYVLNTKIVSAFGSTEKNAMLCIQYGFNTPIVSKKPRKIVEDDREKYLKYWIF
jgi:predicted transcriptional regulator